MLREHVPDESGQIRRLAALLDGAAVQDDASGLAQIGGEEPSERNAPLPWRGIRRWHVLGAEFDAPPLLSPPIGQALGALPDEFVEDLGSAERSG